jgi:cysteine desulfurase
MTEAIYLDYNATTPVAPEVLEVLEVLEAMLPFLRERYGNPSSAHCPGRRAAEAVATARRQVGALVGAPPHEIVFTGSATEANNMAVLGACAAAPRERRHVIVSAVEHPAVLEPALEQQRRGWRLSIAPVGRDGCVDLRALEALLQQAPTALVSVMRANNALGTVQPVEAIGLLVKRHGALFHVDAAQAVGKIPVDVQAMAADPLTIAGHKMYTPQPPSVSARACHKSLVPLLRPSATQGASGLRAARPSAATGSDDRPLEDAHLPAQSKATEELALTIRPPKVPTLAQTATC